MKYISLFLSLFVTTNMGAQIIKNKESAILEVHYIKTTVTDTLKYRSYSDLMTLRVGKTSAMFYPTKRMWADSLLQSNYALYEKLHREMNPVGQTEYKPIGGIEREFLFRNINDGETMVNSRRCLLVYRTYRPPRLGTCVRDKRDYGLYLPTCHM